MVGDAGNFDRLYAAVRNSAETSVDNEKRQWDSFRQKYSGTEQSRFPSLRSPRSAEPHIAFARELGLLEHRSAGGRWLVTAGAGRTFLDLCDDENRKPPTRFLIGQLLRYDRTLLLPFLRKLVQEGVEKGPMVMAETWGSMWKRHRNEMATLEPPVPISLWNSDKTLKRTAKHHSDARIRFLLKEEGLGLTISQVQNLVDGLWESQDEKLPGDYFFRVGLALYGIQPERTTPQEARDLASKAYSQLCVGTYVSASSAFGYINELILPERAIVWEEFISMLRGRDNFAIHPSFQRGDLLYSITPQERSVN
jgi:hypothetical protein